MGYSKQVKQDLKDHSKYIIAIKDQDYYDSIGESRMISRSAKKEAQVRRETRLLYVMFLTRRVFSSEY